MPPAKFLLPALLASVILLVGLGWLLFRQPARRDVSIQPTKLPPQSLPSSSGGDLPTGKPVAKPSPSPATGPAPSPEEQQRLWEAIDHLEFAFRDFSNALGGNPVGTNAEITAALQGDNPKQLRLEIPAGSSINDHGEMCDPWGSPWFFHQLSARKMEIRSAGADRMLYTADDFVR
jgi:hypothetical protein